MMAWLSDTKIWMKQLDAGQSVTTLRLNQNFKFSNGFSAMGGVITTRKAPTSP